MPIIPRSYQKVVEIQQFSDMTGETPEIASRRKTFLYYNLRKFIPKLLARHEETGIMTVLQEKKETKDAE
jgi:hypothetical protein